MIAVEQLLLDLTEEQKQAVTHVDGPLLIIAGAGSGKTRVLTRRVAHLMSLGIPASSILAITFTNKAAGEMKSRVEKTIGRTIRDFGRLDQPWPTICTFHSLCLRILRHYAPVLGILPNFTIYDTADQTRLVKEAMKLLDLSATNFPPGSMLAAISKAKNRLLTPQQFAAEFRDFHSRTAARVYEKYQTLLVQNNAMDFDDLLMRVTFAFRSHPKVLAELQERFQYILIDEYQDTNHAQYILAHALAQKHRNLCVVGDPDQSIYAWRGADIRNILDFEHDYRDAVIIKLERNYRSTPTILKAASQLIAHNTQRKEKRLWTDNADGEKITVICCQDEKDEAQAVTEQLKALHERGVAWSGMAIFYRINALSRVMEDALRKSGVPYQIARGVEFYNRREIKDVLAYLRTVANPQDELSLTRIINTPARGISEATVKTLQAFAVSERLTLWETLQRIQDVPGLAPRVVKSVQAFVEMIQSFGRLATSRESSGSGGLMQTIMERVLRDSGLDAYYRKEDPDGEDQYANLSELINSAAEFDRENPQATLDEYLSAISLVSDIDRMEGAGGAVTLMTLHAAKGLEFPVVAMIGLEEGCLPHTRARTNPVEMEEERRLCFVGITRAQQKLILTHAVRRTLRGLSERTVTSPFLSELPEQVLEHVDRTERPGRSEEGWDRPTARFSRSENKPEARFRTGQMVRHPTFGIGKVAAISKMGQHTRAVVEFPRAGRKTLILEFARLEAVG